MYEKAAHNILVKLTPGYSNNYVQKKFYRTNLLSFDIFDDFRTSFTTLRRIASSVIKDIKNVFKQFNCNPKFEGLNILSVEVDNDESCILRFCS